MQNKMKRGLGLLLLAVPLWVIALLLARWDYPDGFMEWVVPIATLLLFLGAVGCVIVGLALMIWGLLRD